MLNRSYAGGWILGAIPPALRGPLPASRPYGLGEAEGDGEAEGEAEGEAVGEGEAFEDGEAVRSVFSGSLGGVGVVTAEGSVRSVVRGRG